MIRRMPTLAVTKTRIGSACPECGIISKSGKRSCCGRGGSWFGNCGSASGMKLDHTWHEGIRACKPRQFQTGVGPQLHASQAKANASSHDASMAMDSKAVLVPAHILGPMPANTPTPLPDTSSMALTANADDTGTTASKAIAATISTSIHKARIMLTPTPIIPVDKVKIVVSMHNASADMHMTPSHTSSARVPIRLQEWGKFLHVVIQTSMILVIFCPQIH